MIKDKKYFYLGLCMSLIFIAVLYLMFSDIFCKTNAFHASDNLFNSISKGSTNYFPMLEDRNKAYADKQVLLDLDMPEAALVPALHILQAKGCHVQQQGAKLHLEDNLGTIVSYVLSDAKAMFDNNETPLVTAYNIEGKKTLRVWWEILRSLDNGLKKQKEFQAAKFVTEVRKRGVEVAYNFYGIESQKAADRFAILTFSLVL